MLNSEALLKPQGSSCCQLELLRRELSGRLPQTEVEAENQQTATEAEEQASACEAAVEAESGEEMEKQQEEKLEAAPDCWY